VKNLQLLSRCQSDRQSLSRVRSSLDFYVALTSAIALCFLSLSLPMSNASAQLRTLYKPSDLATGKDVNDVLSDKDIPTGQKGFARDYMINVKQDDRLEITVNSSNFDTVLSLIDNKGESIAENDDVAGDSTNSLIFFRVRQAGNYIVRVSSFGGSSGGKFLLRVNKLRVVE